MADYKIKCEVVEVRNGAACQEPGDCFKLWKRTPEGMCCRAFAAVYPVALSMRFSEQTGWETAGGANDIVCPEGDVVYRLSRLNPPL